MKTSRLFLLALLAAAPVASQTTAWDLPPTAALDGTERFWMDNCATTGCTQYALSSQIQTFAVQAIDTEAELEALWGALTNVLTDSENAATATSAGTAAAIDQDVDATPEVSANGTSIFFDPDDDGAADVTILTGGTLSANDTVIGEALQASGSTLDAGALVLVEDNDNGSNTLTLEGLDLLPGNIIWRFPNESLGSPYTIVGEGSTQTLTNKTIDTASNTITVLEADISDLSHFTPTDLDTDYGDETITSDFNFGGATVALPTGTAFPGSPATNDIFVVTDDSATGACDSAAGSALSFCYYNGVSWESLGDGGGGGGGAFSDAGDPIVQNTITKDVHIGDGAGTLVGKLEIGGDADQPQLVVEGFSTQTDSLIVGQNDADTQVFNVNVDGTALSQALSDIDGPGTNWSLDASGNLYVQSLSIEPSTDPGTNWEDSDFSGVNPDAAIQIQEVTDSDVDMEWCVKSGADSLTCPVKLDTTDGGATTLQIGTPGTNYINISEAGALTAVGSATNTATDLISTQKVDSTDINIIDGDSLTDECFWTYETGGANGNFECAEDVTAANITATARLNGPSSATLPGTCTVGDLYWDTDADTDGSLYVCRATDTWKEVDDDGAGGASAGSTGDVQYSDGASGFAAEAAFNYTAASNLLAVQGNLTLGPGTATNVVITANEDTTDGTITWDNANDEWDISNGITVGAGGADGLIQAPAAQNLDIDANGQNVTLGDGGTTNYVNVSDGGKLSFVGTGAPVIPSGAAFPGSPSTGEIFRVTDDSAVGACDSAAGSSVSLCYYTGAAWASLGDGGSASGTSPKETYWKASALSTGFNAANSFPAPVHDEGTNYDADVLAFDDTTDECAGGTFLVPSDVGTGGTTVTFRAKYYAATGATNSAYWDFKHAPVDAGEAWDATLTTESDGGCAPGAATQDFIAECTWTETMTNLGWAASDLINFEICRDADNASDNLSGDANLVDFAIEMPRTGSVAPGLAYYQYPAGAFEMHGANQAPLLEVDGTNQDYNVRAFDDTTDECVWFRFNLPGDFDATGTPEARAIWRAAATSGTVEFALTHVAIAANENIDQAGTTDNAAAQTVAGTTLYQNDMTWNLTDTNWSANDTVYAKLCRDVSEDTLVGDAQLIKLVISVPRS